MSKLPMHIKKKVQSASLLAGARSLVLKSAIVGQVSKMDILKKMLPTLAVQPNFT